METNDKDLKGVCIHTFCGAEFPLLPGWFIHQQGVSFGSQQPVVVAVWNRHPEESAAFVQMEPNVRAHDPLRAMRNALRAIGMEWYTPESTLEELARRDQAEHDALFRELTGEEAEALP
jgi:hypothetical protein